MIHTSILSGREISIIKNMYVYKENKDNVRDEIIDMHRKYIGVVTQLTCEKKIG